MGKKIKVLIGKPGLDGHDRGAKIVANALKNAGMEVVYTGLRNSIEEIVEIAIQEDVDVIGLSILSGAHNILVEKLLSRIKIENLDNVLLIIGGIIPEVDRKFLKELGVDAIFGNESQTTNIIEYIEGWYKGRE